MVSMAERTVKATLIFQMVNKTNEEIARELMKNPDVYQVIIDDSKGKDKAHA